MNDEKPNAVPFLEYVARYAEELGNHAWAESLRHRLAGANKRPAPPTSRRERSRRESNT